MKKIFISALCILGFGMVKAQQIPLFNQNYINPFVFNPAYAGFSGGPSAYFICHNQWSDFADAPVTNALTFDSPLMGDKMGIGFGLSRDKAGYISRTEAMLSLAYKARFGAEHSLTFGLAGGILDNNIDFTHLQVLTTSETAIYNQSNGNTTPSANFGVLYQLKNLELGFSVPQLLGQKLSYVNQVDSRIYYTLVRHYLGTLRYTFNLNVEKGISFYPMIMMHAAASNVPVESDFSGVLAWKGVGWAGVTYRSNSTMAFNLGIQNKGITIGYAYEVNTGQVNYLGNSNEILLGYTFGKTKTKNSEKMDQIIRRMDGIERQNKTINNRVDSVEKQVAAAKMQFERADHLKQDLKQGDVLTLKNVNFEYKSTTLGDRSFDILEELITLLENNPSMKIAIYGHSDDIGSDEYNIKLSEDRAKAVYSYLIEGGIDASRLSYKGFGKSRPLMKGDTDRARAKNRRVEFEVISR